MEQLKDKKVLIPLLAAGTAVIAALFFAKRRSDQAASRASKQIQEDEVKGVPEQTTFSERQSGDVRVSQEATVISRQFSTNAPVENKRGFGAEDVKVEYVAGKLSYETIKDIMLALESYVAEEFIELTLQNRQERRQYLGSDNRKYVNCCMDWTEAVEELLIKSTDEILQFINVPLDTYEESFMYWVEQGSQELILIQAGLLQKLKETLPSGKDLTLENFFEIMQYSLHQLDVEAQNIDFNQFTDPNELKTLPTILQSKINDQIYEKFGIEEEDLFYNIKTKSWDRNPEVRQILERVAHKTMSLMPMDPMMMMGGMDQQGMGGGFGGFGPY